MKPTVVLYLQENIPYYLDGAQNDKLILKSYEESNLDSKVAEAFEIATKQREQRFNFFINPDLLGYLDDVTKQKGVTKSTYLRTLIEQDRAKQQAD